MLAILGLTFASCAALAQEKQEITVTAPRVVHQTIGRSSTTGAPIEQTSISRPVSYSDLDLSKPSGATILRKRVEDISKSLCQELDQLYPLEPKDPGCVPRAVNGATDQIDRAIAAAKK